MLKSIGTCCTLLQPIEGNLFAHLGANTEPKNLEQSAVLLGALVSAPLHFSSVAVAIQPPLSHTSFTAVSCAELGNSSACGPTLAPVTSAVCCKAYQESTLALWAESGPVRWAESAPVKLAQQKSLALLHTVAHGTAISSALQVNIRSGTRAGYCF